MSIRRLVATAAGVAVGGALLAGCTRDPKPLAPKEATPRQVLDAYLLALQAGDCGTTHEYGVNAFLEEATSAGGRMCCVPDRPLRRTAFGRRGRAGRHPDGARRRREPSGR